MRTYFHRANPKPKGGPLYMNIWVGINSTHNCLMEKTQWWLAQENIGLWLLPIHAEPRLVGGLYIPQIKVIMKHWQMNA